MRFVCVCVRTERGQAPVYSQVFRLSRRLTASWNAWSGVGVIHDDMYELQVIRSSDKFYPAE